MRNAVIGIVMLCIITLSGILIYSIEGKTTRQNELNVNLSSAMERSMEIMTIDPKYNIDREKDEHLIADFIQDFLVKMNSNSKYKIEVIGVDAKKGLLSCRVSETYNTVFGQSVVTTERTIVLDNYYNDNDETFQVTFYKTVDEEGKLKDPVKQVNVYGGNTLENISPIDMHKDGYTFKGWRLSGYGDLDKLYTDLKDIHVTQNLKFSAEWVRDAEDVVTVSFYAKNKLVDVVKVEKGKAVGTCKNAPTPDTGLVFKGWKARGVKATENGNYLFDDDVKNFKVKEHTKFTAIYVAESN